MLRTFPIVFKLAIYEKENKLNFETCLCGYDFTAKTINPQNCLQNSHLKYKIIVVPKTINVRVHPKRSINLMSGFNNVDIYINDLHSVVNVILQMAFSMYTM